MQVWDQVSIFLVLVVCLIYHKTVCLYFAQMLLCFQDSEPEEKPGNDLDSMRNEVLVFNTNCPECNAPASTNMKLVRILKLTDQLKVFCY